jgi:hypothetical protein
MKIHEKDLKSNFTPFEITITIENKDELLDLLGRANQPFCQVREKLKYYDCIYDSENVNDMTFFNFIKDKAIELNLIKS